MKGSREKAVTLKKGTHPGHYLKQILALSWAFLLVKTTSPRFIRERPGSMDIARVFVTSP
jgi:hypothetical protein